MRAEFAIATHLRTATANAAPHPPSGGASGTFSLRAKSRLSGGCAPTRACGRSPEGEGSILYYIFKQVIL